MYQGFLYAPALDVSRRPNAARLATRARGAAAAVSDSADSAAVASPTR